VCGGRKKGKGKKQPAGMLERKAKAEADFLRE
jgi:hypothetical protein